MLESVANDGNADLLGADNSLSYCVNRLDFIADGLQAKDITFSGREGISICIKDVAIELKRIQQVLK